MPQFDLSNFPSMILWLCVCFAIVIVFFKWFVLPRHMANIDLRSKTIQAALNQYNSCSQMTNDLLAQYNADLKNAQKKADKDFEDTASVLEQKAQSELARIRHTLDQKKKQIQDGFEQQHLVDVDSIANEINKMSDVALSIFSKPKFKGAVHD